MDLNQDDKETILASSSESEEEDRRGHKKYKKEKNKKRSRERSRSRPENKRRKLYSSDSRSSRENYKRREDRIEKYDKYKDKDKKDRNYRRDDDDDDEEEHKRYNERSVRNIRDKEYSKRERHQSNSKRSRTRSRDKKYKKRSRSQSRQGNSYKLSRKNYQSKYKSRSRSPGLEKGVSSLEIKKKFEEIAKRADNIAPLSISEPSKRDRELFVLNLPDGLSPNDVTELINTAMIAISANIKSGNPVVSTWINTELNYALIEFRTSEEANNAFKLDGISLLGKEIKIGRPRYQDDSLSKNISNDKFYLISEDMFPTLTSFERDLNNPYLNRNNLLAGSSVTKTTCLAPSTLPAASKLLVSNLPLNFDEDAVYKFLRSFGKIKSLEMIKDPITGNYSGQCHIEYETESATANALHYVMGINLQGNILYIKRSSGLVPIYSISGSGSTSSLGILTNGMNANFGGGSITTADDYTKFKENSPSKVICIKNMCTLKELEDDDEYDDLYYDVMEECKNYAKVISLKIPRPQGQETVSGLGKVFVECFTREGAAFAREHLNGKSFKGRIVEVVYHPEDMFRKNQLD